MKIKASYSNEPIWKELYTQANLPQSLKGLEAIAHNLWWSWNPDATRLFQDLNPATWKESGGNPVACLQKLSLDQAKEIEKDQELLNRVKALCDKFSAYMGVESDKKKPSVAYFSMEYGFSHILKIYSGGLGVLAGDYLKEASDSRVDLAGVGFLYRFGYFTQKISPDGQQVANYEAQNFGELPIEQVLDSEGNPMVLAVPFHDRNIYAHIWRANIGRIPLYLLDTDMYKNSELDKPITHQLYGGDWENRIKQEYLLGIGGMLLLNKLGIKKEVYHCNEGHAAFINIQRLLDYIEKDGLSFNQALEVVKASGLYTVHTPVPAGHDYFDEGLLGKYMGHFPQRLGISWQEFVDMGRENPGSQDRFCMSTFALNTCQEANGVSYLHGIVSQKMFQPIWKGYFAEESHVGYVTNGVHYPTWAAKETQDLYEKHFDKNFLEDQSNADIWEKIYEISDQKIWDIRLTLKKRLVTYIKGELAEGWIKNQTDPGRMMEIIEKINPDSLLVGFGRRFATYKRAHLLFSDLDRLSRLVNNEKYPIQFIFTGKAHPADGGGQGLIQRIIEISRRPEFAGKIIFLENYDMRLAKRLISGVDIWLNTPTRPLEASGTSGEKAVMNGVMNFSVLDGWWYEGYREGAGWALTDKRSYTNQEYQDQLDASIIYNTFEQKILPLYYAKNSKGYSPEWIDYVKNTIAKIAPHYTTKRMIDDYIERFYTKLANRSKTITANSFAKAKEIAAWKESVASKWDSFVVESIKINGADLNHVNPTFVEGQGYDIEVIIDKKDLTEEIGVEAVIVAHEEGKDDRFIQAEQFKVEKTEGSKVYFKLRDKFNLVGSHKVGYRVYPLNKDLPHRMDFAYVRWI